MVMFGKNDKYDKVVLTHFRKLNVNDFEPVVYENKSEAREELFFVNNDGRIFVNSAFQDSKLYYDSFKELVKFEMKELQEELARLKEKFHGLYDIENKDCFKEIESLQDEEEKTLALETVFIQFEIMRREVEKKYYTA